MYSLSYAQTTASTQTSYTSIINVENPSHDKYGYGRDDQYSAHPIVPSKMTVHGNRFFGTDTSYHAGEIWTVKGHFKDEMTYRFDQFSGMVQVRFPSGNEKLWEIKDVLIFKLMLEDRTVSFVQSKTPTKQLALLQVIYESPTLQLLRASYKSFFTTNQEKVVKGYEPRYEFVNAYHYYIVQGQGNALQKVEITAKSLSKVFPTKRKKIEPFFKNHNSKSELTVSKTIDLMKMLDETVVN